MTHLDHTDVLSYSEAERIYRRVSAEAAERARARRRFAKTLPTGRRPVAVAVTVAAAAAGIGTTYVHSFSTSTSQLATSHRSSQTHVGGGFFGRPVAPVGTDPFGAAGESIPLSQASAKAGYPVAVPDTPSANTTNVSDVWFFTPPPSDTGQVEPEVIMDFVGSGVRITYEPTNAIYAADAKAAYTKMAQSLGMPASSVQQVHGVPALVQPPENGEPGYVDLNLNGAHIAVIGHQDVQSLLDIANSLS